MNRIMLDLETLGTQAGCIVATLGAVRFTGTEITDEIYLRLDIRAQQKAGLHLDADTVLWWLKREDAARAELTATPRMAPREALSRLYEWMHREGKVDELWGNGADFDCGILAALYKHLGEDVPWRYHRHRCYRTMTSLRPEIQIERTGQHHNALDDARDQARHLMRIWQAMVELNAAAVAAKGAR